jgi:hypothetical protein
MKAEGLSACVTYAVEAPWDGPGDMGSAKIAVITKKYQTSKNGSRRKLAKYVTRGGSWIANQRTAVLYQNGSSQNRRIEGKTGAEGAGSGY